MTSLHATNAETKPHDPMTPASLPEHADDPEPVAKALYAAVDASAEHRSDVQKSIHAPMHKVPSIPLVGRFLPGLEGLASKYHIGNFVVIRGTGERFFESMPLYPRYIPMPGVEFSLG